jgi:hypothetical protein
MSAEVPITMSVSSSRTSRPKQLLRLLAAALAGALGAFTMPASAGAHTAGPPAATAPSAATVGEKQPD